MTDAESLLAHARRCMQHGSITAARNALDRARRLIALQAAQRPRRSILTAALRLSEAVVSQMLVEPRTTQEIR